MHLILKRGREKSLLRRHPWIFAGAIESTEGEAAPGETVDLLSSGGTFLARAAFSPRSQIRARVWTFEDEAVDREFLRRRVRAALALRRTLENGPPPDARRLIHAESDGLPGLIVDRYGGLLVAQFLTAGAEFWKDTLADLLAGETGIEAVYERSDAEVRELEGLAPRSGLLRGTLPPEPLVIREHDLAFQLDFRHGHKTGFYLDQEPNRALVGRLAAGREVLDCFCYTGGFTLHALANGARSVLSVDSSAEALSLLGENLARNALPADRQTPLDGDVFQLLRKFRDAGRSFDMVILDPPRFAPTAAHIEKASRAYKDINLLAFKLLRPGGILATFSCSGGVDAGLFRKIVAAAALDAGAEASVVLRLSQAADHPVSVHFPEGEYLKGVVCLKR